MAPSSNISVKDRSSLSLRSIGTGLLKILVSAALIFAILRRTNLPAVFKSLENVSTSALCAAIAVTVVFAPVVFAARWKVLSGGAIAFPQALKFTWIGFFYSALLPGVVSGDVAKGLSLAVSNRNARNAQIPISILLDRIIGGIVLLGTFMGSCAILMWEANNSTSNVAIRNFAFVGFVSAVAGIGFLTVLQTRWAFARGAGLIAKLMGRSQWKMRILSLWETLSTRVRERRLIGKALLLSMISQTLLVLQSWLLLRALGANLSIADTVIIQASVSVATMLPISFSGIGVREWLTITLFPTIGLDQSLAIAFSWLSLGCSLVLAVGGGLIQLHTSFSKAKAK